ncbi:alpha-glucan family phosphorylase, partial [candidate division KSB1 bacterium]|nr:alpha-glucan family phosphorylase [candidate division KSB1 bacterium]
MKPIQTFTIVPTLPEKLQPLKEIGYNLFWTWDHEAIDLFRRLDRELWEETKHNPVKMLGKVKQNRLEALLEDEGFLAHLDRVYNNLQNYLSGLTWFEKTYGKEHHLKVAYFSAEFGLTECLETYSGGLGVLAGDHLKSASDLGIPMVGVGLLYQMGYFHQYLNADGWQGESYIENDFHTMPIRLQRNEDDTPIKIGIEYPGGMVKAQIWRVKVGRVDLFLLDTNLQENLPEYRDITDELYGGDTERRIQQEIMLGIGGIRALKAMGIECNVFHMNEGHSAFLALERIRNTIMQLHCTFDEASELTKSGNIFTTHTPVPAGIDRFSVQLIDKYFTPYYDELKITKNDFLTLGRKKNVAKTEDFSMAILAINLASHINGVSKLHKHISRDMWKELWDKIPINEIPITSVTNGIHIGTWISRDLATLYDRYVGPAWRKKPADQTIWKRVESIPSEELWRTHERRRERLVAFARRQLRKQLESQGALPSEIEMADEVLNPEALTIGFARRFATYKRATLLLHDPVRLAHIMRNKDFPIQIIFAGKAHPKDNPGKELIRKLIHLARMEDFRQSIVFLEDYDINVARYLVQGVDVWLNTPRRYMEASGTSGMKAGANGVINMSILDGWWDEAYSPEIGWSIGFGEDYTDFDYQDDVESQAIYNLLEKEVIPLFYDRGRDNIPREWIHLMKNSMSRICPDFNTNRMVREYSERFYLPAFKKFALLNENDQQRAREITGWKANIFKNWSKIKFVETSANGSIEQRVGAELKIDAKVFLDSLTPEDICVEIYHGYINPDNKIVDGSIEQMRCVEENGNGVYSFTGNIICKTSGLYGYTV